MTLYAVTIFLSAFLLFQIQPLIAKIILPWFGGSAAVWTASLLFFQLVLLGGYAYAYLSIRFLRPQKQMALHVVLLLASGALLPILPSPSWRPTQSGDPTLRILLLLAATIGLPYFLLSATSPLLQAWYVRRTGSIVPYRLFALSNFGSMLALISFPFLVEPRLSSRAQAYSWSVTYVTFGLLCTLSAWVSRTGARDVVGQPSAERATRPDLAQIVFWVALSACASIVLISVTNHLSQNVAPIPLLWVVPLALYLLTFICAFESDRLYRRRLFVPLLVPALGAMAYMLYSDTHNLDIKWVIPIFAGGLFVCCMLCHGELARRRPAVRHLTLFYLMVSLGGALGGIFVAVVAPRVFNSYLEMPLGLVACALVAAVAVWNVKLPRIGARLGAWPLRTVLAVGTALLAGYLGKQERAQARGLRLQARNFYGSLSVLDDPPNERYAVRTLFHGTIDHGEQLLDSALQYVTTSYYGEKSGVGRALRAVQAKGPARLGFIGLGAGVLSNYGRKGDYIRIYEINPLVESIAQSLFTFYPHSPADKQILLGDARLTLERQETQHFDLIAVDAFSSDAIPIHLLTREATALYFNHLKPDGILALHISNRYLNLEPVCQGDAQALGKWALVVEDDGDDGSYLDSSTWVLLTSNPDWFKDQNFKGAHTHPAKMATGFRPWTDDYSNLVQILTLDD